MKNFLNFYFKGFGWNTRFGKYETFLIFISRVLVGIQGLVSMKLSVSFCDNIKQEKF